jgi:hypothetical protein
MKPMDETQMSEILVEAKAAHRDPLSQASEYYAGKLHALAEAQYLPAFDFFVACLDDERADWREKSIWGLGFHYSLEKQDHVLGKLNHLLLTDEDVFVRMVSATILGIQSSWPNFALINALQFDQDEDVRNNAFSALLHMAGVFHLKEMQALSRVKSGEIIASIPELKRILYEAQINLEVPENDQR